MQNKRDVGRAIATQCFDECGHRTSYLVRSLVDFELVDDVSIRNCSVIKRMINNKSFNKYLHYGVPLFIG